MTRPDDTATTPPAGDVEHIRRTLTRIAQAVWDATRELGYAPECCIVATGAARRLVRRAGWTSDPVPCRVFVANAAAVRHIDAGVPVSQWPVEAWTIGVDESIDASLMSREVAARLAARGAYAAHLVLEVRTPAGTWLLDASAGQFDRPDHRLRMAPLASLVGPRWDDDGVAVLMGDDETVARYQVIKTPKTDYRHTANWTPSRHKLLAARARAILDTTTDSHSSRTFTPEVPTHD